MIGRKRFDARRYGLGRHRRHNCPALAACIIAVHWASLFAPPWQPAAAEDTAAAALMDRERANYSIGYEIGGYLASLEESNGMGIDLKGVLKGMLDALSGSEPLFSSEERRATVERLRAALAEAGDQPEPAPRPLEARERGFMDDYAALNARREGVVSLPSGVQYEVLKASSGPRPAPGDTVVIRYEGKLTTGVVFDTTYDDGEPLRLAVDSIAVPGLREALLLMHAGDKWRVVIPPRMGFGRIGNNQLRKRDLIYELELVSVESIGQASSSQAQSADSSEPGRKPDAGTPD
jgi:FKBP-type peptidyl-prolyl cis-trans isomerase FklB